MLDLLSQWMPGPDIVELRHVLRAHAGKAHVPACLEDLSVIAAVHH